MSEEIKQACHELIKAWEAISGGQVGKYHGNDYQQGLRTAYAQCAYELKEMLAGDREPATSKTPEPSTLASAMCSAAAWPDIGQDPLKVGDMDEETALERIRKACALQQKEVPDQTALVWRIDLSRLLGELALWRGRAEALRKLNQQQNGSSSAMGASKPTEGK